MVAKNLTWGLALGLPFRLGVHGLRSWMCRVFGFRAWIVGNRVDVVTMFGVYFTAIDLGMPCRHGMACSSVSARRKEGTASSNISKRTAAGADSFQRVVVFLWVHSSDHGIRLLLHHPKP